MAREHPSRRRASVATFTAAIVLACAGATGLIFQPTGASAEGLPPLPAEFVVGPGQTVEKTFSGVMIGSAEVRPDPDGCRNSHVIGLTCAAHRIKLTGRQPGYFLRISTKWLSQSAQGTSVPDVDTYLFDGPGSQFAYAEVGGASGAMPEEIKLVNVEQDEYDLVVGAYAGAITEHTVVVEYVNSSAGPSPAAADIVLNPNEEPYRKTFESVIAGETGSPATYALVTWPPDECRNDPTRDFVCDVYRLKLNRNKAKEAVNFVVIELEYDAIALPDVDAVAAGLSLGTLPDMDIIVWDTATHAMERASVGGQGDALPERAGFTALQDEYDIVIQVGKGMATSYTLRAYMTDEIFGKPFEFLDPVTGQPLTQNPDGTITPVDRSTATPDVAIPSLGLAPIDVDDQIAGIGLGTTEQFDREEALRLGQAALRNVSITNDPPAAWILWLAMLVVPAGFGMFFVVIMRRRHQELV